MRKQENKLAMEGGKFEKDGRKGRKIGVREEKREGGESLPT
jgi:hypothetical protein